MQFVKTLFPAFLIFFSLACNGSFSLPFVNSAPATPAPAINFDVVVIYPTPTAAPVFKSTPVPLSGMTTSVSGPNGVSAVQSLQLTSTLAITAAQPIESPTVAPTVVVTQPAVSVASLTETEVSTQAAVTAANPVTGTTALTQVVPPAGPFVLLEPVQAFALQAGINELEFKWRWTTEQSCQPPEGFGYELRLWPAVTGYGPMGVTDAVANQQAFFCDPKSNVASYRVDDLKGTPGVSAVGAGKFLWDVAYIQLEPYTVILSSGPHLFEIP